MRKVLLWVCIVVGGIALLVLLFNIFVAIVAISVWLIRIAAVILLICFGVIAFNAVKERLMR